MMSSGRRRLRSMSRSRRATAWAAGPGGTGRMSRSGRDIRAWCRAGRRGDTPTVTSRSARLVAVGSAAGAVAVSIAGVALAAAIPGYFATFVSGFLLVNAAIGVAYAVIGGCVAWARPRNSIGWLF